MIDDDMKTMIDDDMKTMVDDMKTMVDYVRDNG